MWSNLRPNKVYDSPAVYRANIRCRFTEKALGTWPGDPDIYASYIASNAPDAKTMAEDIAIFGEEQVREKGITVFPSGIFYRSKDGQWYDPIYQIIPRKDGSLPSPKIISTIQKDLIAADARAEEQGKSELKHGPVVIGDCIDAYSGFYAINRLASENGQLIDGIWVENWPYMCGYQIRGGFKEKIALLNRADKGATTNGNVEEVPKDETEPEINPKTGKPKKTKKSAGDKKTHFAASQISAHKKVVDTNWFVKQKRIPFDLPDTFVDDNGITRNTWIEKTVPADKDSGTEEKVIHRLSTFTRSLRADTAQGPRTSIACSEIVPAGTEFWFTVILMQRKHKNALIEVMDSMERSGMLQWRSGGMGTLIWTPCDEKGNPIDEMPE